MRNYQETKGLPSRSFAHKKDMKEKMVVEVKPHVRTKRSLRAQFPKK